MNLNLLAAVRFDKQALSGMLARGSGVILHVASIQHRLPLHDSTLAYAAAIGVETARSLACTRAEVPLVVLDLEGGKMLGG